MRAIDSDGKQLGVIATGQALALASQQGLDLVEAAPNANPPVCKITDFGKYKYEQTKREREARKHQHATKLKEIKLRLNIDPHDYDTKMNHMREFLKEGMKVKVSLFFRGRENAHPELGEKLMQKVMVDVEGSGRCEVMPKLIGKSIHMLVGPVKGAIKKPSTAANSAADNEGDEDGAETK